MAAIAKRRGNCSSVLIDNRKSPSAISPRRLRPAADLLVIEEATARSRAPMQDFAAQVLRTGEIFEDEKPRSRKTVRKERLTMCDYSLMMMPNRLAIEGEELVAHRFQSGSLGLVSRTDYECWAGLKTIWEKIKAWLSADCEPGPVVCIPPGARLRLSCLPETLRDQFGLASTQDATFFERSFETTGTRDALRFDNGAIVPLELLPERQQVKVLRLASTEEDESDAEWHQLERVA